MRTPVSAMLKKWMLLTMLAVLFVLPAGAMAEGYPESAHPYDNDSDISWSYTHPEEAAYLAVTFSADTEFENNFDFLYVTCNGTTQTYTGTQLQNQTIGLPGYSFTLRLTSDGSVSRYGFAITQITGMTQEEYEEYEEYKRLHAYTIDASGVITAYTGLETELVIPSEINGIAVTGIGSYAFQNNTGLTSVVIPEGVTSIGDFAFYGCGNLTSIEIPEGVMSIGCSAFEKCRSLVSAELPDSVMSISDGVFIGCTSLKNVRIPDGITGIPFDMFFNCRSLTSIELPDSVTHIGPYAFENCALVEIELPEGVTSIGMGAFQDCDLTSIEIPASMTSIGSEAFIRCSGLKSVVIPEGVRKINSYAFADCISLMSVEIPASMESIGKSAFMGCSSLTNVEIPNYKTDIELSAFLYCESLERVTAPGDAVAGGKRKFRDYFGTGVKEVIIADGTSFIGHYAFSDCDSLTSIVIPDSVSLIEYAAFSGCSSLESIAIPYGVTSIEESTFEGCSSLVSVDIPDSVTSMSASVFSGCSSLKEIRIPYGVTKIKDNAFYNCSSLSDVDLPDSLRAVRNYAFYGCSSLEDIVIPDSVKKIEDYAFAGCSKLTSVEFSGGVESIGYCAFEDCSRLNAVHVPTLEDWLEMGFGTYLSNPMYYAKKLYVGGEVLTHAVIPDGREMIGDYCFRNVSSLKSVEIPDSVMRIGEAAFENCGRLTEIDIPDSVMSIGAYAFYDCGRLEWAKIPGCVINGGDGAGLPGTFSHYFDTDMKRVVIADGVTNIGNWAFAGCSDMESIEVPGSVGNIGAHAFAACSSLRSVVVPKDAWCIGDYAFHDCQALENISIPAALGSIGVDAFSGCDMLRHILIAGAEAPVFTIPGITDFVICCYEYSETDFWAMEHGYETLYLDGMNLNIPISFGLVADRTRLPSAETAVITPIIFPAQENPVIEWSSSAPEVATVENGVVMPLSAGTATITAVCGGVSASVEMQVYIQAESFGLSEVEMYMISKEKKRIAVTDIYPSDAEISFAAVGLDQGIAEIAMTVENGVQYIDITAKRAGDTEIIVTENVSGMEETCAVCVFYPVTEILFDHTQTDVVMTRPAQLTANVTARDRSVINKLVTFTSSDETIATVDENGLVTGHAIGSAVITAAAASGVTAQCIIDVRDLITFTLPAALRRIEAEAFENCTADFVILPSACSEIGARAFAGSDSLTSVYMPDSVTEIADDAFEGCDALTFVCESDNAAAAYAQEMGIPYTIQ